MSTDQTPQEAEDETDRDDSGSADRLGRRRLGRSANPAHSEKRADHPGTLNSRNHLAEAYRLNCEVHTAYNALNNVATLHVLMAIANCDWFEVLAFNPAGRYGLEHLSYGLARPIEIDGEGFVHAPTEPGLGFGVDWTLIDSARLGEIS